MLLIRLFDRPEIDGWSSVMDSRRQPKGAAGRHHDLSGRTAPRAALLWITLPDRQVNRDRLSQPQPLPIAG